VVLTVSNNLYIGIIKTDNAVFHIQQQKSGLVKKMANQLNKPKISTW